LDLWSNL